MSVRLKKKKGTAGGTHAVKNGSDRQAMRQLVKTRCSPCPSVLLTIDCRVDDESAPSPCDPITRGTHPQDSCL